MKKVLSLVVVLVFQSEFSYGRVIYGEDERVEIYEGTQFQQRLAHSAATIIQANKISIDHSRGLVNLDQRPLQSIFQGFVGDPGKRFSPGALKYALEGVGFCDGERFLDQPNPGICSGFLIAPDLVLTAGHCVTVPNFCSEFRWVFGFQVDPSAKTAGLDLPLKDVYKCDRVVADSLLMSLGFDYAIVKLDRVVSDREPLRLRTSRKVVTGTELLVIGSPSGLPLKIASGGSVRENTHPFYFSASLDTYQGNSGSAVFNNATGVVEGILVRGEDDFVANEDKLCIESKRCESNDCRGEDVTRTMAIPEIAIKEALNQAAFRNDVKMMKNLFLVNSWVDFYGHDGVTALMWAAKGGASDAIMALIDKGAEVNRQDASGDTPLHYLASVYTEQMSRALSALLENGANHLLRNSRGQSALQVAMMQKDKHLFERLVAHQAKKVTPRIGKGQR